MRVFHCFIRVLTLYLTMSGPALAGCSALMDSIELAEQNFSIGKAHDAASLRELNQTIREINNDDVLLVLRGTGQASAFGDLRNFLTQLKFISEAANRDTFQFTPRMQQDLGRAREIVNTACDHRAGPSIESGSVTTDRQRGDQSTHDHSLGLGSQRKPMLSPAQKAFLEESFNLSLLARLIAGVAIAVALVLFAHYGLVLVQVLRRNRRICEVPAEFTCMMNAVPGSVTVLGRHGCVFLPASPDDAQTIEGVTKGTYCTLHIQDTALTAKLLRDVSTDCRILFAEPISKQLMKTLLTQSEKPVRYDFSVMRGLTRSLRRFGTGSMPPAY
ncbi:MAG: hypothetical protein HKP51_00725 [Sulfitobacter sp.]|nr:hypothetical protein [Sulfitobacter sp.]